MQTQRSEDDIGPCSIIFCLILKTRSLWIWRQVGESSWFFCLHLSQHWGSKHTQSNQVGFCFFVVLFCFWNCQNPNSVSYACTTRDLINWGSSSVPHVVCFGNSYMKWPVGNSFLFVAVYYSTVWYPILPTHINWLFAFWLRDCCYYEHSFTHKTEGQVFLVFSRQYIKSSVGSCAHHVLLLGELPNLFLRRLHHFFVPQAHFPPFTKHSFFSV